MPGNLDSKAVSGDSIDEPVESEATSEMLDRKGTPPGGRVARKIGATGAVFLILNKMIGTGSKPTHQGPLI